MSPVDMSARSGARPARGNATPSRRSVARERPTCQDKSRQAGTRVARYRRATAPMAIHELDLDALAQTGEQRRPVSGKDRLHKELVLVDQSQICQRQGERHAAHPQALAWLLLEPLNRL